MKDKLYKFFFDTPVGGAITIISGFGFAVGLIAGAMSHERDTCKYQSVFSRINITYIVGCELTRSRFSPTCYPAIQTCENIIGVSHE